MERKHMLTIIQILTGFFVLLSLALVIAVPVALAIPGLWETYRDSVFKSTTLWTTLVFLIAFSNALAR